MTNELQYHDINTIHSFNRNILYFFNQFLMILFQKTKTTFIENHYHHIQILDSHELTIPTRTKPIWWWRKIEKKRKAKNQQNEKNHHAHHTRPDNDSVNCVHVFAHTHTLTHRVSKWIKATPNWLAYSIKYNYE